MTLLTRRAKARATNSTDPGAFVTVESLILTRIAKMDEPVCYKDTGFNPFDPGNDEGQCRFAIWLQGRFKILSGSRIIFV